MNVHDGRVLYNKTRFVERVANHDGFMDVDHELRERPGVLRVGFFGDSYVEAVQVPFDAVFFHQLEQHWRGEASIETFGCGMSGWGTLHALRAYQVYGPRYGIDVAVYVFVENDPGDQMWEVAARRESAGSTKPFLEASDDPPGYRVRAVASASNLPFWFAAAKFLQRNSLLVEVVRDRLEMLRQTGVRIRSDESQVQMSPVAGAVPDSNDLPSTWPRELRTRAERLGEIMLEEWKESTAAHGTRFLVLYVPRGETQLRGTVRREDTWLPWLESACSKLGIPLIDPSAPLARRLASGEHVYLDHWTPAGHEVIAEVLDRYLEPDPPQARPAGESAGRHGFE